MRAPWEGEGKTTTGKVSSLGRLVQIFASSDGDGERMDHRDAERKAQQVEGPTAAVCPTRLRSMSEDADGGEGTKYTTVGGKAGGDSGSDQAGVSPGETGALAAFSSEKQHNWLCAAAM